MSSQPSPFLPERPGETDDEQRLREAMNRLGGQMLGILDAAIELRTADNEVQRSRHLMRGQLQSVVLLAMHTHTLNRAKRQDASPTIQRR